MGDLDIPNEIRGTLTRNDDETFTLSLWARGDDGTEQDITVVLPFSMVLPMVPMFAMASALPPAEAG